MTTIPVLPPMLARMPEPGPIVIGDVARRRLAGLLKRHDFASERSWILLGRAADLGQLVKAFEMRDVADSAWARFHAYAQGVAAQSGVDGPDAVTRVRRQIESEARS